MLMALRGRKTAEGLLHFIEMYNHSKWLQIEHTVRRILFGYFSANVIMSLGSTCFRYLKGNRS